jgi:hypothetical protein
MGTHNLVLRLGDRIYLEVIAIDPAGNAPSRPRWFGLDDADTRAQLRVKPRLLTWAARASDIERVAKRSSVALGSIHAMERGDYKWRITIPDNGALLCGGLIPTVIQWDCATHPADRLADCGHELASLEGEHPDAARTAAALAELGLQSIIKPVDGQYARLAAAIRGLRGVCTLVTRTAIR